MHIIYTIATHPALSNSSVLTFFKSAPKHYNSRIRFRPRGGHYFSKILWITMVFPSFFPANTPSPPLRSSSSPLWFYVLFISFYFILFCFCFLFCFLVFSRFNLSALIRIRTTKSALLHPFFKYLVFDSKIIN